MRLGHGPFLSNLPYAVIAIALAGPLTWMMLDREPPYISESGRITAAPPDRCGLPDKTPVGLMAGGCAAIDWKIKAIRNCKPASQFNVTRVIVDQQGQHVLPKATSIYSLEEYPKELTRYFPLPTTLAVGPASYRSTALYACNPLQYFFPIVVDRPDVLFTVGEAKRGPK